MGSNKTIGLLLAVGVLTQGLFTPPTSAQTKSEFQILNYTFPHQSAIVIDLHPGLGTNISFEETDQKIETIFINNKSFFVLSTNGCLDKNCPPHTAPTIVNVAAIDRTDIPGSTAINQEAGRQGLLTIVTTDGRKRTTQIFAIRAVSKASNRNQVSLIQFSSKPNPPAVVSTFLQPDLKADRQPTVNNLVKGLKIALKNREIDREQLARSQKFIMALHLGDAKFSDAPKYGLDLTLVARLVSLGSSTSNE